MAQKLFPGAVAIEPAPAQSKAPKLFPGAVVTDTTGVTPDESGQLQEPAGLSPTTAQDPDHQSTMVESVKRGTGQMIGGLGRTGEDLHLPGATAVKDYGTDLAERNPASVNTLGDIVQHPGQTLKEGVGEAVPQVGAAAAGAGIGAAIGAPFAGIGAVPGAVIGGTIGAFGLNLGQEYGQIRQSQDQQGIDKPGKALVAASAASAIDMLGPEASIPRKTATRIISKAAVEGGEGLVKRVAKGAAVEGLTEAAQTGIERVGAEQPLTGPAALDDYAVSAAKGAAGGGVVSGVMGHGKAKAEQPTEQPINPSATHDVLQPANNTGPRKPGDAQGDLFPDAPETSPLVGTISAAAKKHGVDPQTLVTIARIESGLDPNAQNPNSTAGGLFQFLDRTAGFYGLKDKNDPAQASDAAARMTAESQAYLKKRLGRDPEPWELYLAHQQGPGGAARLLRAGDRPAAEIVGEEAVRLNGGTDGMSARDFAGLWQQRFETAGGGRAVIDSSGQPGAQANYDPAEDLKTASGAPVTILQQLRMANSGKASGDVIRLATSIDSALKDGDAATAGSVLDDMQRKLDAAVDKLDEQQTELDGARGEHTTTEHAKFQSEIDRKLDTLIKRQNIVAAGRQAVDSYTQANATQAPLDFNAPTGPPLQLTQPTAATFQQPAPAPEAAPALARGPRNGELFPAENQSPTLFPEPTPQPVNPAAQTQLAEDLRGEAMDDAHAKAEASVRKSMLDQVLADSTTRDATKRFVALLKRTERDPALTDDESKALATHAAQDTTLGVPERAPVAAAVPAATPVAAEPEAAPEAPVAPAVDKRAVRAERARTRAENQTQSMGATRKHWFQQGADDVLRGQNEMLEPRSPPAGKTRQRWYEEGKAFAQRELDLQQAEDQERPGGQPGAAGAARPVSERAPAAAAKAAPKGAKTRAAVEKVKAAKVAPPKTADDAEAFDTRLEGALSMKLVTPAQYQKVRVVADQGNSSVKDLDALLDAAIEQRKNVQDRFGVKAQVSPTTVRPAHASQRPELSQIHASLQRQLDRLGLHDVGLRVVSKLRLTREQGSEVEGTFQSRPDAKFRPAVQHLITVAFDAADPNFTLDHEAVHALRELNLFTDPEWSLLSGHAKDGPRMVWAKENYDDETEEVQVEEAIAQTYADWAQGRRQAGAIGKLLQRIKTFFQALRRALTQSGYRSAEEVFAAIEKGDVGARTPRGQRSEAPVTRQMYVGQKARSADTGALARARVMEGAGRDADTVRSATGWFRGAEKAWRTEVSDKGASLWRDVATQTPGEKLQLSELLRHPTLFNAYPELRTLPVEISKSPFMNASFNPGKNLISLSIHAPDPLRSLLHEIQHWVQKKEGFASGSSPKEKPTAAKIDKLETWAQRQVDDAQAILDKRVARGRDATVSREMVSGARELLASIGDFRKAADEAAPAYAAMETAFTAGRRAADAGDEKAGMDALFEAKAASRKIDEILGPFNTLRHEMYLLSAGEREARDTALRAGLDDTERGIHRPYSAEGIRDQDTIVTASDRNSVNEEAVLPREIREPAQSLMTTLHSTGAKASLWMPFTEDVAALASKYIPSAKRFIELNSRSHALSRRYEERLADIKRAYHDLPATVKGSDKGSVNDFLMATRMTAKWGFQPSYLKAVVIDPEIQAKFEALPKPAQAVVKDVLHFNWEARRELMTAVVATINAEYDPQISQAVDQKEADELKRQKTEALKHFSRLHAARDDVPYSPLKRSGEWVVMGMSEDYAEAKEAGDSKTMAELRSNPDHYWVNFYDTAGEAAAAKARVATKYAHVQDFERSQVTDQEIGGKELYIAFGELRAKIAKQLTADPNDQVTKQLYRLATDLYLQSLSDTSARKGELKADMVEARDPVTGEAIDMMKAFVTRGQATTHFVAAMGNAKEMHAALDSMEREAATIGGDRKTAERLRNELMWRYVHNLNRKPSRLVNSIVRAVSIHKLLLNPVYYAINLTQVGMFSVPAVAGRVGYLRAQQHFLKAYADIAPVLKAASFTDRLRFDGLPADVRGVLHFLTDRGRLDAGLSNELGSWELNGNGVLPQAANFAFRMLAYVPQNLETLNRVVTGIAAYRAAKAKGDSEQAAYEYASQVIYDTHGDYSGFNEPRFIAAPGGVGKIAFQFRKFQVIMATVMAKMIHNSFKGASPEEKWIARKSLAFTLAHTVAMGGLVGFPAASTIGALVVKAMDAITGDDKDWDDWEMELEHWLRANAPPWFADLLYKGAPYALLHTDLSGRLGLGNLTAIAPFSDAKKAVGDRDALMATIGQLVAGPVGSIGANTMDAIGFGRDGDPYRAMEAILPEGIIKGAAKSNRYATRGVETKGNDTLFKPSDLDSNDLFLTAIGVPSKRLADQANNRGRAFEMSEHYKAETTTMKRRYTRAQKDGDTAALKKVREDWNELQAARAEQGLKRQPLSTLLRAPREQAGRERRTIGGVPYTAQTRQAIKEMAGSD